MQKARFKHPILSMIRERINTNKNWMALIQGETGAGKSYTALRIGEILDENFSIKNVVFTPDEFSELLKSETLKMGSVVVFDEGSISVSSKEWFSYSNKLLNNIIQTFRTKRLVVLFTLPNGRYLDSQVRNLFHAVIEPQGVAGDMNSLKILKIMQNYREGKVYYAYYRFQDDKTKRFHKYILCRIGKPSKELCEEYEKKRTPYSKSLELDLTNYYKHGIKTKFGKSRTIEVDEEKIDPHIRKRIETDNQIMDDFKNNPENFIDGKRIDKYYLIEHYNIGAAHASRMARKIKKKTHSV